MNLLALGFALGAMPWLVVALVWWVADWLTGPDQTPADDDDMAERFRRGGW